MPRRSLGGFQGDIAAETLRYNHVGRTLANAVAFDEADVVKLGKLHRTQQLRGLANFLVTFYFLDANIEQADGGPLEIEQDARHGAAHQCQRHQMLRVAADGGAEIEHNRITAGCRPYCRERRTVYAWKHAKTKSRHRHQCSGIAGGDRHVGLPLLDGIDRKPHRRRLAAAP